MNRTDDECYTGTGPAAEVVGSFWSTLPLATSALHSESEEGQPTYTELLAQRDELASKLNLAILALEEIGDYRGDGPTYTTPWQDIVRVLGGLARAALSRIKGA